MKRETNKKIERKLIFQTLKTLKTLNTREMELEKERRGVAAAHREWKEVEKRLELLKETAHQCRQQWNPKSDQPYVSVKIQRIVKPPAEKTSRPHVSLASFIKDLGKKYYRSDTVVQSIGAGTGSVWFTRLTSPRYHI